MIDPTKYAYKPAHLWKPMKKFVGKPYAGKPHVRIDEGVGKVFEPSRSTLLAIQVYLIECVINNCNLYNII